MFNELLTVTGGDGMSKLSYADLIFIDLGVTVDEAYLFTQPPSGRRRSVYVLQMFFLFFCFFSRPSKI